MPSGRLRTFSYLDADLVDGFLAQLEGGVVDHITEFEREAKKRGIDGGAGFGPVRLGGEKGSETERTRELLLRQITESAFTRLYDRLDEEDEISLMDSDGQTSWDELRRQQVVEVAADLQLPDVFMQIDGIAARGGLADLIDDDEDTADLADEARMARLMAAVLPQTVLVGSVAGARDYGLVVALSDEALRVKRTDRRLSGEVTVFATLTRRIPDGQAWTLADIADMSLLASGDFEMDERALDDLGDGSTIDGPAAVLHPVAIYI